MEIKSFYDFIKNIVEKTGDLTLDGTDFDQYIPLMTLNIFGLDEETCKIAVTLSTLPNLTKQQHYKYLYYSIPKQSKLGSWYANNRKMNQEQKYITNLVNAISYFYGHSLQNAFQEIILFNAQERDMLISEYQRALESDK